MEGIVIIMTINEITEKAKPLLSRFRAENHGTEYIMRAICSWLVSVAVQYFFIGKGLFDKEFAANTNIILFAATAVLTYLIMTAFRFIPVIKEWRTDAGILLAVSACAAVGLGYVSFYEHGEQIWRYAVIILFFALALWFTAYKFRLRLPSDIKDLWAAVIIAAALIMLLFSGIAIAVRYYALSTPAYDFGIFTQMFENMKDGFGPVTTVERGYSLSHFSVHFSPAYYLMLPFYMIYPHPVTLELLQGIIVTSGIIPVFLICRKYGFSKFKCAAVCVIYAFYPALTGACRYDLHENCMLVPFMLWLFWAIEREKPIPAIVFTSLTLLVKEDAAIYTAVIGLYLIFSDRPKKMRIFGAYAAAVSVIYFLTVCVYLQSNGLGIMSWRYDNYISGENGGLIMVIASVILNPVYVMSNLLNADKAVFAVQMLAPLGFVPFISKKFHRYILLIPFILINLMPDYVYQYSINFQYVFGSGVLLIWLFIMNCADMKYDRRRFMCAFSVVSSAMLFMTTMFGVLSSFKSAQSEEKFAVICYLEQFPVTEESITCDTFFAPALYKQKELYSIQTSKTPDDNSNPISDIVLLDRAMSGFQVSYNYYTSHGMKETEVDGLAANRVCRLEKKA